VVVTISLDVVSETADVDPIVSLVLVDVERVESIADEGVVVIVSTLALSVVVGTRILVDVVREAVLLVERVKEVVSVVVVISS